MKKGKQKRKKPSASLYTSVVKPNQLEEEKPLIKSNLSKHISLLVSSKRSLVKEVSFYFEMDKFIKKVSSSFSGHPKSQAKVKLCTVELVIRKNYSM